MEIDSVPSDVDDLQRRLNQLEMEKLALEKETEKGAVGRRDAIDEQIAELQEELAGVRARWEEEKRAIDRIRKLQAEQEQLQLQMEQAERSGDLARASELKYGETTRLASDLQAAQQELARVQGDQPLLREEVTEDDVAELVARWTGIPATRLVEEESAKLRDLENRLRARVIGQEEAVAEVARTVRRSRAGLIGHERPLGSFLFLGPTGVGKTELVKALAEQLFGDEKHLVRLDMSEYMERHAVARMIGAPPGYVGFESGGQLTEAVRRHPYSVILLDEVEKAHPEVTNVLLQLLDDGRLTDGKGRVVDFRNTLVVMTSNLCQDDRFEPLDPERSTAEERDQRRRAVLEELQQFFRPEMLNRLDGVVRFGSLDREEIRRIVRLELARVDRVLEEQEITLTATDAAVDRIAEQGWDPRFGARPVKRVIQREVQDRIADAILAGDVLPGYGVEVDYRDGEFTVTPVVEAEAEDPEAQDDPAAGRARA
jgi:ATP-dependent Clp protease ATP-binding subunit ClpB